VTERAGDAESRDAIIGVHRGLNTNDSVHLQQRHSGRWALEINLAKDAGGQNSRIDLQADFERSRRIDALLDDFMQPELVGPELIVAKGVKSKDLLSLRDKASGGSRRGALRPARCQCVGGHRVGAAGGGDDDEKCTRHGDGERALLGIHDSLPFKDPRRVIIQASSREVCSRQHIPLTCAVLHSAAPLPTRKLFVCSPP